MECGEGECQAGDRIDPAEDTIERLFLDDIDEFVYVEVNFLSGAGPRGELSLRLASDVQRCCRFYIC